VLDTDWNPFNDSLIASGSDDGKVFLWRVPDGFTLYSDLKPDEIKDVAPVGKLSGHPKKVGHVLFNPAAENVLASNSGDFTVKLWDVEAGSSKLTLKVGEVIQSMSWSANGSLLVTTSRDKKLRIWDVRQEKPAVEVQGHTGAKSSRAVWLGEHDRIATTGFSRMSDRQIALWDIKAPQEPLGGFQSLDSSSGVCMPFWDEGTQCLYLAGKGDGNIRYMEYENDKFEDLSEYKSADPQRGVAFVPKRGVNMHENEVARAYKTVNDSYIEPISFIVPRRAETFQDDIYPPTTGLKPAMTSAEWFGGKEGLPPKFSMESIYEGEGMKEVSHSELTQATKAPEPLKAPEPSKAQEEVEKPASSITAGRVPQPSTKDQMGGGSMMAAADKFADNEPAEEEAASESSFEEVQKPVERTSAIKPTSSSVTRDEAVAPASDLWKDEASKTGSGILDEVNNPNLIFHSSGLTIKQPDETALPSRSTNPSGTTATETDRAETPTPTSPATGSGDLEREVRNMKTMMAQQTRQLASLAKTVADLVAEVKTLKDR
jgi:coronin-1B/1C/6